ncbi:MAG: ribosomal protein L13e [Candidatus Helarchaeota archaeon]
MSNEIKEKSYQDTQKLQPIVKKPKKYLNQRKGKGFSLKEIKSAGIPLDDAKHLSLPIDFRRKSLHEDNVKILSTFYRAYVSEKPEDQVQLEVSKKEAFRELKQLRGIKGSEAKILIEAGVKSLKTLIDEDAATLAADTKIREDKIQFWINQAKTLLKRKSISAAIEDLLQIKGMNKAYAKRLIDFGILSITDLSEETAEILSKDIRIAEKIVAVWIEDARRLTGKPIPKKKKIPPKKPAKAPSKAEGETKKAPRTLKDLEGISKGDLKALKDLGITKIEQLIEEDTEEIATITGINKTNLERWIEDTREYLGLPKKSITKPSEPAISEPVSEPLPDPLTILLKIEGVGKKTAEKLIDAGIKSLQDLIECDPKELSKSSKISEKTLMKIIKNAKNIL